MNQSIIAVIPTYNQKKDVKEAVESLLAQTQPVDRVVVVDNASPDHTSEYLQKYIVENKLKSVEVIRNKKNEGVTGGRNRGIEYANGAEFVLFFDHDMVAESNMVEELLHTARSDKKIGIVTPKIYYWDKKNIIWSAGTDVNLTTGQTLFRGGEDKGQYEETEEVSVAPAVLLVKNTVLMRVHKFDPIYFATYEDTDFCFRAKRAGFSTFYTPKAVAYHKIPLDEDLSNKRLLERSYWVARNRMVFMKRFGENFLVFLLISPAFIIYYLILSVRYKKIIPIWKYLYGSVVGIFS